MSDPTLVCAGWWADRAHTARVHDDVVVLRQGDDSKPRSHGICKPCMETFIALLPAVSKKKEAPA